LPKLYSFGQGRLDPNWTARVSGGASLGVAKGGVELTAPAGAQAHIEHVAPADGITMSATLTKWASIYLVWGPENWCGVGQVSPTPFGRYSSTVVVQGKASEIDHRGMNFALPHRLRIQLGTNLVRFLSSDDGVRWAELRTIERPAAYSGAPKLIAAGKYYQVDNRPFGAGGPASEDSAQAGRISDLRVEMTPIGERTLSDSGIAELRKGNVEPVEALLMQGTDDPTFEAVAPHYPSMKFPREIVGVPAHPLDIGVDWLGRMDVSPWTNPVAWLEVGDPPQPLGSPDKPFDRHLLDGYLPLITLTRNLGGVEYQLSIFGCSEGFDPANDLIAYARLTARAPDDRAIPKQIALVWGDGDKRLVLKRSVGPEKVEAWSVRFKYPDPRQAVEVGREEFERRWNEAASMWRQRLAAASRFDLPDARVMAAYRAWIAYSQLDADTINGYLEPHDGAGFYEEMFGNSVSLHTIAMDQYGLHDWAAKVLDTQIHFQHPDGLYTQACGLTDPGGFLYGLAEHYRITGDRAWLARVGPAMVRQCDWLVEQRKSAPRDGILRGLIKFRPYNDYPDPTYNYLGNAWCAKGMERAAAALREIDAPAAGQYAAEATRYRQDLLDSMTAAAFVRDGQTLLPMEPDTRRLLKLGKYQCGDYYGLVASPLLGIGLFPPTDTRADWIVDGLEKRQGLLAGVCQFEGGIDHAYTYGYLMTALQRDQARKTLLGFWSFLAFGMTRETYSPVEVSQITTGENHLTLPHLYSCTEQLRLLRALLLREEDQVLWIGQGIPRAWLTAGRHVAVTSAPTEFGDVSYRIDSSADGTMRVHIDPPTRHPPAEIRLRLREPRALPIRAASTEVGGKVRFSDETIFLPGADHPIDLRVQFGLR
jgi:hypothetical protein